MPELLVDRLGHITVFALNRPDKLDTMSPSMAHEFTAAFGEFEADPDQYVAVITGSGDRDFSSGADLTELASRIEWSSPSRATGANSVDLWGVGRSAKPTVAGANKLAVADGLELSLNCDVCIVADTAWFGVFDVKRGIMAGIAVKPAGLVRFR